MTKDNWLSSVNFMQMLSFIYNCGLFRTKPLERKSRLFALACTLSAVHHLRDARSRDAVDFASRKCDCNFRRLRHRQELQEAAGSAASDAADRCEASTGQDYWRRRVHADAARAAHRLLDPFWLRAALECGAAVMEVAHGVAYLTHWPDDTLSQGTAIVSAQHEQNRITAVLLRDIFGNPFRPVAFDSSWQTDTAVSVACQTYESRDFSPMPILADALQDAGCENEDILTHCRGSGPHVRGCWVVDLMIYGSVGNTYMHFKLNNRNHLCNRSCLPSKLPAPIWGQFEGKTPMVLGWHCPLSTRPRWRDW